MRSSLPPLLSPFFFLEFSVFATSGNTGLVGIYGTLAFLLSWIDQDWFGIVAGRTIRGNETSGERRSQTRKIIWALANALDVQQPTRHKHVVHTPHFNISTKKQPWIVFFLLALSVYLGLFFGTGTRR